jgi:hypothetical protein
MVAPSACSCHNSIASCNSPKYVFIPQLPEPYRADDSQQQQKRSCSGAAAARLTCAATAAAARAHHHHAAGDRFLPLPGAGSAGGGTAGESPANQVRRVAVPTPTRT